MSHRLAAPLIVAAAMAVPPSGSWAQTTGGSGSPAARGTISGPTGSSGAASAVGTAQPTIEVQQHLRARGYGNLQLTPDSAQGGWSGTAIRDGQQVKVHVAPNGNVSER